MATTDTTERMTADRLPTMPDDGDVLPEFRLARDRRFRRRLNRRDIGTTALASGLPRHPARRSVARVVAGAGFVRAAPNSPTFHLPRVRLRPRRDPERRRRLDGDRWLRRGRQVGRALDRSERPAQSGGRLGVPGPVLRPAARPVDADLLGGEQAAEARKR